MSVFSEQNPLRLRKPALSDGPRIWRLVRSCRNMDLNSLYSYLLLCSHFRNTCVVAEADSEIVGFVSAYKPPNERGVLFVWQIVVREESRGRGLAKRMLAQILRSSSCGNIRYLKTTVSPANQASKALFLSMARELGAACAEEPLFPADLFEDQAHEEENLLLIGPFNDHKARRKEGKDEGP
ncbi:MAG: diaminobutyrate acetyltransferase [Candidatus Omnitrophica bacterium]|nr:diaminobutyrate acetyltransferase [Candidatus Omnitrophota bacterium]